MNTRTNRRARTGRPIRDNSIFGISLYRDGFGVATLPYWYRRHVMGAIITGPANR